MKADNVGRAAILSTAYFFSKTGKTTKEEYSAVKSDNDWIAQSISKHPEKFVGFFSVNPLSGSALVEIERNAAKEVFAGLKLQLTNSKVDFRNSSHIQKLAKVFKKANSLNLGIVVHMRTQDQPYGEEDAAIFIDRVLSKAPDVPVQIAHLAGWGGYEEQTDAALSVFANRSEKGTLRDDIYFDLSAVIRPVRENAGKEKKADQNSEWYPEQRYQRATEQIRKVGVDRMLFGTDWPDWMPASYKSDIIEKLELTEKELYTIFCNRAPWFK